MFGKKFISTVLVTVTLGLGIGAAKAVQEHKQLVYTALPVEEVIKATESSNTVGEEEIINELLSEVERLEAMVAEKNKTIETLEQQIDEYFPVVEKETRPQYLEVQATSPFVMNYRTAWDKALSQGVIPRPSKVNSHRDALNLARKAFLRREFEEAGTRLVQAMVIYEGRYGTIAANHVLDSFLATIGTRNIHSMPIWFDLTSGIPGSCIIEDSNISPTIAPEIQDYVDRI